MPAKKSKAELRADALLAVIRKGRANQTQAALLLGVAKDTLAKYIGNGRIKMIPTSGGRICSLAELIRAGLVLPPLPSDLQAQVRYHLENDPLVQDSRYDTV